MKSTVLDHPLAAAHLTELRDESTTTPRFRQRVDGLARALAWEAARYLATEECTVTTPVADAQGVRLSGAPPVLVPVLRAGVWMVDGALSIVPDADVAFVGLARDEATLRAVTYLDKLPADVDHRDVWILDPMLATGGSLVAVAEMLATRRPGPVTVLSLLAAPEGLLRLREEPACDDWHVVCASIDEGLNEKGFIVPGLGDAGDRLSG
ncbi:MAG TPA: uracil phosphoribosyltransferase [Acidimicrobiales bacterium]|jgi:uracil phosphoribosyltransferase|nr:uracil phosphoribosyltransferase [Acidimicrobiales bacterium]